MSNKKCANIGRQIVYNRSDCNRSISNFNFILIYYIKTTIVCLIARIFNLISKIYHRNYLMQSKKLN